MYRETVTSALPATPASRINIIADVDGAFTGDPGEVIWTAHTTNDTTAPAASSCYNLNGKKNQLVQGFTMIGGNTSGGCIRGEDLVANTDYIFRDLTLIDMIGGPMSTITSLASPANWLIERCSFMTAKNASPVLIFMTRNASMYDANIVFNNCFFYGPHQRAIGIVDTGGGTNQGGGVIANHCTFLGNGSAMRIVPSPVDTTHPCAVYNSVIICSSDNAAIHSSASGGIVEDYNLIWASTPRNLVTAGSNSISNDSQAPLLELMQSFWLGRTAHPFLSPLAGAPILGKGVSATPPALSTDYLNRPRPAGGGSTSKGWGAFELHDTAVPATDQYDVSPSVVIVGPGDHDLQIPVANAATVISVMGRFDTNHGTTTRPQMQLVANGEIGYAGETKTMTVAVDTWETITFTSFTPTKNGLVTLRLINRASAGTGKSWFDTVGIA